MSNNNYEDYRNEENNGCLSVFIIFPVIAIITWIVMAFCDIRTWIPGIVAILVSAICFKKTAKHELANRFIFSEIVGVLLAIIGNLLLGIGFVAACLVPFGMVFCAIFGYVFYENIGSLSIVGVE